MATGDPVAASNDQVMAPPPAPAAETGIQASPDATADPSRIPLPQMPATPAVVPESHKAKVRFLDGVLVLLLLLFAFLCASFKATNSDFFQHLAAGRLLAQGAYTFGADPFTFTAEGTWVNHAWLYDLLTYLLYSLGNWGGIVLVVLKALLITVTVWLMLRVSSLPGQRLWIPIACTMLAVLALSPRMLLQPHVVSFVFLALTLYLLTRPTSSRAMWGLPLLCLAWVNLDGWFFLGPITILLYLAGEALQNTQRRGDDAPADLKRLALVLLASLAGCLVSPHHIHAFTVVPVGMLRTGAMETFRGDVFRGYFVTPFESVYLTQSVGLSAAGLAFYVLLTVSFVSFIVTMVWNLDGLRYWRVLVWLAMTMIAVWNIRAIPYFAVVAGPIASLNYLDLMVKLLGAEPRPERRWLRMAIAGRVLTIFAAMVLVVSCIPGWLQAQPYHRRQVGFGIEVDAGLREAAQAVASWREQGLLPAGQNWFNTSPEVVYYFAWFCPGEKCFVDGRLEFFGGVAKDFLAVRKSLSGEDRPAEEKGDPAPPAWRRVFGNREVSFLVFHSPELANNWALTTLKRVYSNPDEFVPCYIEGGTAILAWRSPQGIAFVEPKDPDRTTGRKKQPPLDPRLPEDFNLRAFGNDALKAPAEPSRPAGSGPWWQRVLEAKGGTPAETLTAVQHLQRFDGLMFRYQVENEGMFLGAMATQLVGIPAASGGPFGLLLPARMCLTYNRELFPAAEQSLMASIAMERLQRFLRLYDAGPMASLYLALRSTRQGLAKNPDDIVSQIYLAQTYSRLHYQTREQVATTVRTDGPDRPSFDSLRFRLQAQNIRRAQMAAAGQSVLKVGPRPEQALDAHMLLTQVFSNPQTPYFESHVKHVKEVFRLTKLLGLRSRVPAEQFRDYIKGQEENVKNLDRLLKSRRDQYEVDGSRFRKEDVLQRANLAASQGLSETALNLLTTSDPKLLSDPNNPGEVPGITLMLDLLFGLGRIDDVREILVGDVKAGETSERRNFGSHWGLPAFDWFSVQLGAATGDYESADRHLAQCIESVRKSRMYTLALAQLEIAPPELMEQEGDPTLFAGMLLGMAVLEGADSATLRPWHLVRSLPTKIFRARPPHPPKRNEDYPMNGGVGFLMNRLEQEADLWTLRAWLALEAGSIEAAKEHATKALNLADMGQDGRGQRLLARYRSQALAALVQILASNRLGR